MINAAKTERLPTTDMVEQIKLNRETTSNIDHVFKVPGIGSRYKDLWNNQQWCGVVGLRLESQVYDNDRATNLYTHYDK